MPDERNVANWSPRAVPMTRSQRCAVLITGATGFIGRTLVPLIPNARAAVRCGGGSLSPHDTVIVGDICGDTEWLPALEGVRCVVHLAAHVHVMKPGRRDEFEFHKTNVLGTQQLASMAAKGGVQRFIFLSSIKVNGETSRERPFTAEDVPRPQDPYGISKWEAEQRLFEIAERTGMEAVAVRSPLVYGPGVRANFLRLIRLAHSGLPLPLGAIRNKRSMVSVWNLCDLLVKLIDAPAVASGPMMVSDGVDISAAELVRKLACAMGRPSRLVPVPVRMLEALAGLAGRQAEVARLCSRLQVDISGTRNQLDWAPPITIDEGLRRTVSWYISEGRSGAN